jgi:hypothetical protein
MSSLFYVLFAPDLLDLSRWNFAVEKLDADAGTSTRNLFPFDVGDPAGENLLV